MSQIERVGVVGCGLMGSGIAEVCGRAGLDVVVREVNQGTLEAGPRPTATRPWAACASPPTSASSPTGSSSSRP